MFNWFLAKGLRQGIFWSVMIYVQDSIQDVLIRFLGVGLHYVEIVFFRFFFSLLFVLIPIILFKRELLHTRQHGMHLLRGSIGAVALALCAFGVLLMPLVEHSSIMFSQALFTILLSIIFLKEKVGVRTYLATVMGFCGVLLMFRPSAEKINICAFVPTMAAILLAVSNIIIKKMVDKKENNWTMLLYFGLYTTLIAIIFVPFFWKMPNSYEILLLLCLGLGANLMQLFIFLAYRATTVSSISHVSYIEILFATFFGFLFFGEVPEKIVYVSVALIVFGIVIASRSSNLKKIME